MHLAIRSIIDQGGYPSYERIGYQTQESFNNMVLHIIGEIEDESIWPYFEEVEKAAVAQGDLQSKYLANHADFYHFEQTGKEIYGSSMFETRNDSALSRPIENVQNIDQIRMEAGLMPMEYHLNKWAKNLSPKHLPAQGVSL